MDPSDFPPLFPAAVPAPSLEERLSLMEAEHNSHRQKMEAELSSHRQKLNTHSRLLLCFAEREVIVLAAEILKWAVGQRGDESDHGGFQLYGAQVRHKVLLAARAYGAYGPNPTPADVMQFKAMSKDLIILRNKTAHFGNVTSLKTLVKSCKIAIKEWPSLEDKYPQQVKIIKNFGAFKQLLPNMFQ